MKLFTIGYGGRGPQEFTALLEQHGIGTVVDVRLRPDRASMGVYAKAKSPEKGIERLLADAGIKYLSAIELGNVFMEHEDWREPYRRLLDRAGQALIDPVLRRLEEQELPRPWCLMCAEKRATDCHRGLIADHLSTLGFEIEHLE
jgi:uncharacterized protein (DUF488 family)